MSRGSFALLISDIRKFSTRQTTELDIWIPKYKLAFEYNGILMFMYWDSLAGPHHYRVFFNAEISQQIARDNERRNMCKQLGITLIEVPYWWDEREGINNLVFFKLTLKNHFLQLCFQCAPI